MIGTDLHIAQQLLSEGQLVAIPTETVYGLAGNGFDPDAVAEIFRVKNRPSFDPLILHTSSFERLEDLVSYIPENARKLAETFWPGALTLLLPKTAKVPDMVTSGLDMIAVRVPRHPLTLQLLQNLPFPLAAPSANPFGYISPTSAKHVARQLGDKIPYILDGGNCEVGIESTIIGFSEAGRAIVYRKGGIPLEQIEAVVGKAEVKPHSSSKPQAPGMLERHYAPKVPMLLGSIAELLPQYPHLNIGTISFAKSFIGSNQKHPFVLSPSGDYREAARKIFAVLRELDELHPDLIIAELLPEKDLGVAINDRLRRAAAGSQESLPTTNNP